MGEVVELDQGGLVLGLFPDAAYPTGELPFEPGDRVVLYTDGVTEARDQSGAWFGDRELRMFVEAHRTGSPGQFLDALLAHLRRWSGRSDPFDDGLTIVVIDRRSTAHVSADFRQRGSNHPEAHRRPPA